MAQRRNDKFDIRGINHLALVCKDMKKTVDFYSGVLGIIARVENGRLVPGAKVERCDGCERYESDEAAHQKLIELGMA